MPSRRSLQAGIAAAFVFFLLALVVSRGNDTAAPSIAAGGTTSSARSSAPTGGSGATGTTLDRTSGVAPAPSTAIPTTVFGGNATTVGPASTSGAPGDPSTPGQPGNPSDPGQPGNAPRSTTTKAVPVTVEVLPDHGATDGAEIAVKATPNVGSQIFGFEARLCRGGTEYRNEADFDPMITGKCISKPLSAASQEYQEVPAKPPYEVAETKFKVGVGTDSFKTERGEQVSITCGPGHPCVIVLKLQYPDNFAFRSYPVSYD